jgi:hypothetical protein
MSTRSSFILIEGFRGLVQSLQTNTAIVLAIGHCSVLPHLSFTVLLPQSYITYAVDTVLK